MEIKHQENGTCIVDNKYIVTPEGKVFTIYKNKRGVQEQKLRNHTNGYLRAIINMKDYYVHRLVAMCFIDNPHGYNEVNHKDGNKKNNCVENLEWCNRSMNCRHCFQTGLRSYDELSKMAKMPKLKRRGLSDKIAKIIKESSESDTILAKRFNTSRGKVWQIKHGVTYKEV